MVGATLAVAHVYAHKGTRKGCPYECAIKTRHFPESLETESRLECLTCP